MNVSNGRDRGAEGTLKRYPSLVAHMIAESLGYATPSLAAQIVAYGAVDRPHYCEWISACYENDARKALTNAIRRRHRHKDYMADYRQALALVRHYAETGDEPVFASWF